MAKIIRGIKCFPHKKIDEYLQLDEALNLIKSTFKPELFLSGVVIPTFKKDDTVKMVDARIYVESSVFSVLFYNISRNEAYPCFRAILEDQQIKILEEKLLPKIEGPSSSDFDKCILDALNFLSENSF